MTPKILVVDDDEAHRQMLSTVLQGEGYQLLMAASGPSALDIVADRPVDLILLDIRMEPMDGVETHQRIRAINPSIPVVMMTAYASIKTAVELMKAGAQDYLIKPVDIDQLKILVHKQLHYQTLEAENQWLKARIDASFELGGIITRSPVMFELFRTLEMVAPSDATVLITGESGTGKELIANAIHQNSRRRGRSFIPVNCAALPEPLLEAELFGHEKGAYTGAHSRREGRFKRAHEGTLFLDEVGELTPATQAKLLRVLQEQAFEPVGGTETVFVDVRIVAATNRSLADEIKAQRFREDLFFRLNVVQLEVPPLRDREGDVPLLAEHFLKAYADKNRRHFNGITSRAMDILIRYDWPGNVRELGNVIERAVILEKGDRITPEAFPPNLQGPAGAAKHQPMVSAGRNLKEMEREMILNTLSSLEGNRTKTAETLGISRRTLQNKLKEYGVN